MAWPVEYAETWAIPPGHCVDLAGRGTTFVREVAGPPGATTLMLLHGLGATAALNWFSAFEPLSEQFRVVALDHRGHGRGIRSRRRFRLADCADDVVALADRLGVESFIPVGYSMGGPIAQLIWHRHPERVQGLVLCATSRNFRGRWREGVQFAGLSLLVAGLRLAPRRALAELAQELPGDVMTQMNRAFALSEVRRNDLRMVLEAAEAIGRFSSREWIGGIDVPVSVVVTAADHLVPVRRQVKMARAIPSAVVHVVDGNHLACGTEPDRFAATLLEACSLVARRATSRPRAGTQPPAAETG